MPKVPRKRTHTTHESAAKLVPSQRNFAVQDNAVEHVKVGEQQDLSANEILQVLGANSDETKNLLKKKEKQAIKHEAFIQRLASSVSPYHSKSHGRREKRRLREQLGTGMASIKEALAASADKAPEDGDKMSPHDQSAPKGLISTSKGSTLSAKQRKRALEIERARQPAILKHPSFHSNPFETIRLHASNTLIKRAAAPY